jgi:CHAT domain-containing protein
MTVEKYDSASYFLEKALAVKLRTRPAGHPDLIDSYFDLARLAYVQGRYRRAIDHMNTAIEIRRSNSGRSWWPDRGMELTRLARYYYSAGEPDTALSTFRTVVEERISFLEEVFPHIPENLKLWYARVNSPLDEGLLAMAMIENEPELTSIAFKSAVIGKGIVIDALMAERTLSYCADDEVLPGMLQEHGRICTEIAEHTLKSLPSADSATFAENLTSLYLAKDSLETEISKRCAEYESTLSTSKTEVDDVIDAIPDGAVLWDIVAFRPWNFQPTNHRDKYHPRKYIGFVVSGDSQIEIVDLGDAASIDSLTSQIQMVLTGAPAVIAAYGEQVAGDSLATLTGKLYSRTFQPLREASAGADRILVSPDRELNLVPLEILTQPNGRYVIEEFNISYLSSSRDLARSRLETREDSPYAILVASPDYDAKPATRPWSDITQIASSTPKSALRDLADSSECLAVPFDPLPAALEEGSAVSNVLQRKGKSRLDWLTGPEASEDTLKVVTRPPVVLHLATHGFSCSTTRTSPKRLAESPLLNTGLALAGANRVVYGETVEGEDGILTAFEASALNLFGTELAVLSSCQSGVGMVWGREGVFGLRRAFQHAGARSIIMSLFDVPDESTAMLMERFYGGWLDGQSKATALRSAALDVMRGRREAAGAAHPLYWGGFILVGDPN